METSRTANLWENLELAKKPVDNTPLTLIKQQAQTFTDEMDGILIAEVSINRRTNQEQDKTDGLEYSFYLKAPFLDNYRFELFSVVQGEHKHMRDFPLRITVNDQHLAQNLHLTSGLSIVDDDPTIIGNIKELGRVLKRLLNDERTIEVIRTLYSQSLIAKEEQG